MTPGAAAALLPPRPPSRNAEFTTPLDGPFRLGRASRDGYVRRRALVRRLSDSRHASVAAIVAPPGYGKSTLISEWEGHDARPFFWPAIDERAATDLGTSASAILTTLEQAGWVEARGKRKTRPDPVAELRAALRSLSARGQAFVLVLDDVHRMAPDVLRGLSRVMIEEAPSGTTLALASRSELPLPLGRLRAGRALVEVRMPDLAMIPRDGLMLVRLAGLELEVGAVRKLVDLTEGWPVGLYLAATWVHEQEDPTGALELLRGDHHLFGEYFRDELLCALSEEQLEFALRTSVLDELSGPICDELLGRHGSGLTLRALERATPLLRPLDPAHERCRWHSLLRDALQAELRRSEPELVTSLNARASAWYEANGDIERAITHAVAAHDPGRAGQLLWPRLLDYLTQGHNRRVQSWLTGFSDEEIKQHAPLALCAAYSSLVAGDAAHARHWAVAAAAADQPNKRTAARLSAGLTGLEALLPGSGVSAVGATAASALALESPASPWCALWLFLQATALHLTGDLAAAEVGLEHSLGLASVGAPAIVSLCLSQGTMIAIERSDWDMAAELADRAVRTIEQHGLSDYPLCALGFAAAAAVRAHHGRLDEAKRDLRRAVDLLAGLGDFAAWYGAEARILLAHASLSLADVVRARTLLAEASRLARRVTGAVIFDRWFNDAWSQMDALAETSLAGPSSLTIAELRVLRFLPSHRSLREIAAQLCVSGNTVKTQAHAVYRKLGAASRSEAVARAREAGLLGQ
ncbi:MAG: LuxR C-terminal-related transcriptional regulator [Solirubrobacteraceae bacterium]